MIFKQIFVCVIEWVNWTYDSVGVKRYWAAPPPPYFYNKHPTEWMIVNGVGGGGGYLFNKGNPYSGFIYV